MSDKENYQLTVDQIIEKYNIKDIKAGLNDEQVRNQLDKDGLNKIEVAKEPKWKLFVRQFNNMIIYILIVAALITLLMSHYSDALVIALVVIINALIGYYQEANASEALEKIKQMLSTKATVYRNGIRDDISAEQLVVGDVVFLEAGDNVPADLRIFDADNLRIQEAALTGEPDSIEKIEDVIDNDKTPLAERKNMAYASTSVTSGSGKGIVVDTGANTEIGKISSEVSNTKSRKSPLMIELDKLGTQITYVIIAVSILLFILGLFMGTYSLSVLSLAVVSMLVGAIPEGLPATTSVVLAMGVSDMAKKKHTIIKSLPAIETLGSVDVIATDKTGTLTKNEMTVKNIIINDKNYTVTGDGYDPKGHIQLNGKNIKMDSKMKLFLESGYEANDTVLTYENNNWEINGEPTDGAFLTLYHKEFNYPNHANYQEVDTLPFDSDYRYIAKLVRDENGQKKIFIKGSPDKLFNMTDKNDSSFDETYLNNQINDLSKQGKRVIAVGYKDVADDVNEITHDILNEGITFLGLAAIIDPPREEVIQALKAMNSAGVRLKMITGDNPITAKAIGEQLGLADQISAVTGAQLDEMSNEQFKDAVLNNQVFARTTPKNKMDIIQALEDAGKVTAMTGDGVNDAPALKKADIGVAMGIEGTDVAKDSADMILTDDNFSTMAVAIKEGRRIYDNIKKSILFLLPTSFAEGLIIAFTILMNKEMPLQPTQLLWINMVSAITIQFAFIFEPAENGIMKRKPRNNQDRLLNKHDVFQMIYISCLIAIMGILVFEWLTGHGYAESVASTMVVNVVVFGKIFYLFNIRTSKPAISKELFTNMKAFWIIGLMIVLQLILTYVPFMQSYFYTANISLLDWLIIIVSGAVTLIVAEIGKMIRMRLK
ncbi:HAD-IC family P-type ATPase [Apilactobacillus micheneri]|uniref:HAD-IC family P-type ATPase n=1 Tax=Apilactobacillus micheneri TaxID=1899430 RepID=UPI000D510928|nr:HAD-IC family P-type ATPase [Apilactobacillus micheneri]GAY80209.1 putative cation-transporting ATPase F [Apilactobacillus micheneri]